VAHVELGSVTDASGNNLISYTDAGLNAIAGLLEQRPPTGQGKPGLYVEIQTAKDKLVPNSRAVIVAPTNVPNLTTTISAKAEEAAQSRRGAPGELTRRHPAVHRPHPGHRQR
jgi:hypothetical protein